MGRYGVRVGRKLRNQNLKIEEKGRSMKCPSCGRARIKKLSVGVWKCRSCSNEFSGGAFYLSLDKKISEESE